LSSGGLPQNPNPRPSALPTPDRPLLEVSGSKALWRADASGAPESGAPATSLCHVRPHGLRNSNASFVAATPDISPLTELDGVPATPTEELDVLAYGADVAGLLQPRQNNQSDASSTIKTSRSINLELWAVNLYRKRGACSLTRKRHPLHPQLGPVPSLPAATTAVSTARKSTRDPSCACCSHKHLHGRVRPSRCP
jgi:hypothetical protein